MFTTTSEGCSAIVLEALCVAVLVSGGINTVDGTTGKASGATDTVGGTAGIVSGTDWIAGGAAGRGGIVTELALAEVGGNDANAVATAPVGPNTAASFCTKVASASGVGPVRGATAIADGEAGGGTLSTL